MRKSMSVLAVFGLLVAAAGAQDEKKKMEFPKPGKEHEQLNKFEGRWDAVAKGMHEGKTEESKGTETVTVGYDGYWYVLNYNGMHDGKTFTGHGMLGYDPNKKKYLLTWIDNMSPYAMWAEGESDSSGKTFTFTSECFCPELGKVGPMRSVFEFQDDKHRTLTFFRPDKTGTEKKMATIFYTRQS
jgi:hypothetical protein